VQEGQCRYSRIETQPWHPVWVQDTGGGRKAKAKGNVSDFYGIRDLEKLRNARY